MEKDRPLPPWGRSPRITDSTFSACWYRPDPTDTPAGEIAQGARPCAQHADVPLRPAARCGTGHGAARRPLDDLCGAVRDHERTDRLSDRKLLRRHAGDVRPAVCKPAAANAPKSRLGRDTMKRLHVHVAVDDLSSRSASIRRCSRPSRRSSRPTMPSGCSTSAGELRYLDARPEPASIISAFRSRTATNCMKSMPGCTRPAAA